MIYRIRNLDGLKTRFLEVKGEVLVGTGGLELEGIHYQDCCEDVYVDWSSLDDTDFFDRDFYRVEIEFVDEVGFRINGYLVNCYNEQNGYYSSDLTLEVTHPSGYKEVFDMAEFMEHKIY